MRRHQGWPVPGLGSRLGVVLENGGKIRELWKVTKF